MKNILWLVSWYPDEMNPYNGDFIQRHALAVAEHIPLTVIYVAQHGPQVPMPVNNVFTTTKGNLTEIIIYFRYKKTGLSLLDKIRYNWKYFYHFRKYMRQYLAKTDKPDLIHVHIPMKAGRIALWLKQNFSIPFLVSEHSSAYSDEVPDSYHRRSAYYRTWVRSIFEQAITLTTVSQQLGKRLQKLFNIPGVHIIPNVVDTRHFYNADLSPGHFRFLHASTMDHPKNVEGILRALHQLKQIRTDWECVMLGWDTPALKALSASLQLDHHVQWKGIVSYQQVALEMQEAQALVLFSRYENQPCVILEALCCGLPVIATSVGGIPELINESNGILVNSENEQQLLEACLQCMNSYERFDSAVISAQAKSQFSYQVVGKQFADLYNKILESP